jgi:hypothetical protein
MNQPIMQAIAFALGCILALQSASPAFAQNAATGPNDDPQQPVASTPAATSSPADQASGSATSGGSQETSPYPEAPTPQTLDVKESLRVKQTKEAAKKQDPIRDASQRPQGAAAGAYTTGVAAYQPAGAAIAPAKQRRSRSFLIRLGIWLVQASPWVLWSRCRQPVSKPPGSR